MKSKALFFLLLFFLLQVAGLSVAVSADTPTLTWERGRQQTITLGGDTSSKLWKITLVDSTGKSLPFMRSSANSAGFLVYSIDLADALNEGEYQIMTQGPDLRISHVANVTVIPISNYNPQEDPRGVGAIAVVAFTVLYLLSNINKREDIDENFSHLTEFNESIGESINKDSPSRVNSKFESAYVGPAPDRINHSKMPMVVSLDHARFLGYGLLAKKSRLLTQIFADGAYLQSLFGIFSLLLPITGLTVGLYMGLKSDLSKSLIPTSLTLFLTVIVIGILDSMSGVIAAAAFALCALVQGRVNSLVDLRTLLWLSLIAFAPTLIAGAIRPLRRAFNSCCQWEKVSDVLIAAVLTGWVVQALVIALDGFSQQKNPIATHSKLIGIVAGVVIGIRYLFEDFALRFTGKRLTFLTPRRIPNENIRRFLQNVSIKTGIFLLFSHGFLGLSWQIMALTLILVLPSFINRFSSHFPNFPAIFHIIPSGLPALLFLSLVGILLNNWINALPLVSSDKSKMLLIILALPAFFLSALRLLGRHPASGDLLWFRRKKFNFLYKFGGLAVFALTVTLMSGAIT